MLAHIVNRTDMRMVERRSRTCFALETLPRAARCTRICQEFDRYRPLQTRVFGLVNDTHPTGPEFLDNSVVGNDLSDHA